MDPKLIPSLKVEALRLSQGNLAQAKEVLAWFLEDTYEALVALAKEQAAAKDTPDVQSNN